MIDHELSSEENWSKLLPDDAAALDALVEASLNADAVGPEDSGQRARARSIAGLLELLECDAEVHGALADVTFQRVLQVRRVETAATEPDLSEADKAALDAWVMEGHEPLRAPAYLRDRARRIDTLASLVTTTSVPVSADLVDRTMALIEAEVSAQTDRLKIENAPAARGLRVRLADLVSVAAVLLIGAGVLMPVMTAVREQGRRALCSSNLQATASAMGAYANSNRDSMPLTTAGLGNGKWWDVGKGHSNSANLFTLARTGYTHLDTLACPGNPTAVRGPASPEATDWRSLHEISYSYQIMMGRERPLWMSGKRAVILADRSPVVLRSVRGEMFDANANAPNHRSRGQHLLYNDGSAEWAKSPTLPSGDNIWITRGLELRVDFLAGRPLRPLQGTEIPDAADDACLGP
jgi:hypothetical protein